MDLAHDGSQSERPSAVVLACECPPCGPKADEAGLTWLWHMGTMSDGPDNF